MRTFLVFLFLLLSLHPVLAQSVAPISNATAVAAGSPVARSLGDRFAEIVNVKNFGAVGDCSTDDATGINAAATYIRNHQIGTSPIANNSVFILYFPTACYVVKSTINLTGIRSIGSLGLWGNNSTIWGQTSGTPVIDAMGSRFMNFKDVTIYGDGTLTPNIGVQHGITQSNPFSSADDNHFDNVNTQGFFTFTSWYNRNSEESAWYNSNWRNQTQNAYTYVADGSNYWNITSAFISTSYPQHTAVTFLSDIFINMDIRETGGGHTLWLNGTRSHRWISNYLNSSGSATNFGITAQPISGGDNTLSACTITFSAPASGGYTATGTVTLSAGSATGIVITNPGYKYPNTPGALAGTINCTGGAAPTAGTPTLTAMGAEPVALYSDVSNNNDVVFDNDHMETTIPGNFLLSQTTTGAYSMDGLSFSDRQPFAGNAVLNSDSSVTSGSFLTNMTISLSSPNFLGSVMFSNPSFFTVTSHQIQLARSQMWNAPQLSSVIYFGSLSGLAVGGGSMLIMDPAGSIYLKGNITQLAVGGTTGSGGVLGTSELTTLANGTAQQLRATGDGGMRMGTNNSSASWQSSVIGDTNKGVEVKTGGTTAGGVRGLWIDLNQSVQAGLPSLSTTATDGFLYVPTSAGAPTGTPTAKTGYSPIEVDVTNDKICFWDGAAWKCAAGL